MIRKCTHCGKLMMQGYNINDIEYFCSIACLKTRYSMDEYLELYSLGIAYWTEWEIDDEWILTSEQQPPFNEELEITILDNGKRAVRVATMPQFIRLSARLLEKDTDVVAS